MEYKDYYKMLGVEKNATPDAIKQAYRRLARKYHPDVSKEQNAEEKFKDLQEAYEVLKDPQKRTAYDQLGSNWQAGQEFRPPPGWEQFAGAGGRGGGEHTQYYTAEDLGGFSDFFEQLFGGRAGGSRAQHQQGFRGGQGFEGAFKQRGADQHAKIHISLEEAYRGTSTNLQLQLPEVNAHGQQSYKTRTLKVNIPAGAQSGQQLRLAGQGSPGMHGGPPGDIYLEIEIEPNALYSLQGKDVYLTLPVAPWEAALGADIKVPTLGGTVGLKLKPDSQAGQKLRLKGRGMPGGKGHTGDQYVVLQIVTPPAKTESDKALYQQMATAMPFNPRQHWGL